MLGRPGRGGGLLGRGWEASWDHLGPHGATRGDPTLSVAPLGGSQTASRGPLGALSWPPSAFLGPSWASAGPS
eukprot:6170160-Pyramimonas_sp.AAC.1